MAGELGTVAEVYLYPVKSMAGYPVEEAHVGLDGILGDRQYSFVRADRAAIDSFPWMTARQDSRMLMYKPQFAQIPTPSQPEPVLQVSTPEGRAVKIADPSLRDELMTKTGHSLFLLKSTRGIFDCQHISLFSLASVRALSAEADCPIDHRQFRANVYMEPASGLAFDEEEWVGCLLQIGGEVLTSVVQRDPRCMVTNLDPETGLQNPEVLRAIAQRHEGQAGLYLNVIRPGSIRPGDVIRRISIPD